MNNHFNTVRNMNEGFHGELGLLIPTRDRFSTGRRGHHTSRYKFTVYKSISLDEIHRGIPKQVGCVRCE